MLDRNGLRPSRFWVTDDDLVVMASGGVIDIEPEKIVTKAVCAWTYVPHRHGEGRIVDDEEIKKRLAAEHICRMLRRHGEP